MNKKGFTLVELLAVIVILAIIALISSAIILNVIETSKKGALEDSAYGIVEAGEMYYMQHINSEETKKDRYDFQIINKKFVNKDDNTKELKFKGKMPKTGTLQINNNGSIAIAICDDDYCACKSVSENKVTVKDTSCNISADTGEIENGSTISSVELENIKKDIEELKKSQGGGL